MLGSDQKLHKGYMLEALNEAHIAFSKDEVPVGSILVYKGIIIARDHNRVEKKKDCIAHAEMLCIRKAAEVLGDWRLIDATLYTTLEPCSMCAGAIILSRITTIVWGASNIRYGAGGTQINLFAILRAVHKVHVIRGILEQESSNLLKYFFSKKRSKCL